MDAKTAEILDTATRDFYETCAGSFSDTRQAAWPGWERLLALLPDTGSLSVLDLGCGNLRFERFLASMLPEISFEFHAVDRCVELVADIPEGISFTEADVSGGLDALSGIPQCDLVASFALLHHISQPGKRLEIVRALLHKTASGGIACISFWQFDKDERLLKKALEATGAGCVELGIELDTDQGDYLLGWQNQPHIYRYCHSFSNEEIDSLVASCGATVIDDYYSDGSSGDLNRYLILSDYK